MLKQLGITGLVVLLFFQTMDSSITVAYYIVYKQYITDFFCINKAKPEMQCHGKCYLSTKLAKQEEQEQNPVFNFDKNTIEWAVDSANELLLQEVNNKGIPINTSYLMRLTLPYYMDIFHPPQPISLI